MRLGLLVALLVPAIAFAEGRPIVVHEWGTFTSLQDPGGRAIGGLNSNDEPLPGFVHRIRAGIIANDSLAQVFSKGIVRAHPDVTMRLETPVLYFYPPDQSPVTLDVKATFNGGILSEFYPKAKVATTLDGKATTQPTARITDQTVGSLEWKDVRLDKSNSAAAQSFPQTDAHVWISPRAVKSAAVRIGSESEQYIFYRGLGHVESPIAVRRVHDYLDIRDARKDDQRNTLLKIDRAWLAEFTSDGACAFREILNPVTNPMSCAIQPKPATFVKSDFAKDNVARLRDSMHKALVDAGLFDDEANAMLETWKLSYFSAIGQRLFFLVPRDWTDAVIPLEFSKSVELTRVMVGRIELVTPAQQQNVKQLVEMKETGLPLYAELYQSLGRFAQALIADHKTQAQATAAASR
jgi:hypothetical protein